MAALNKKLFSQQHQSANTKHCSSNTHTQHSNWVAYAVKQKAATSVSAAPPPQQQQQLEAILFKGQKIGFMQETDYLNYRPQGKYQNSCELGPNIFKNVYLLQQQQQQCQ